MTLELEDHKRIVNQLRARQDDDDANIQQRSREVEELRAEVERLGLEVRRLRGIIEESLKERRRGRPAEDSLLVHVDVDAEEEESEEREEHGDADHNGGGFEGGHASYELPSTVETLDDRAPDWELYGHADPPQPQSQAPQPSSLNVEGDGRPQLRRNIGTVLSTVAEERSSLLRGSPDPVQRPQSRLSQLPNPLLGVSQHRQQRPATPVRDNDNREGDESGEREFKSRATFNSSGRQPRRFINVRHLFEVLYSDLYLIVLFMLDF